MRLYVWFCIKNRIIFLRAVPRGSRHTANLLGNWSSLPLTAARRLPCELRHLRILECRVRENSCYVRIVIARRGVCFILCLIASFIEVADPLLPRVVSGRSFALPDLFPWEKRRERRLRPRSPSEACGSWRSGQHGVCPQSRVTQGLTERFHEGVYLVIEILPDYRGDGSAEVVVMACVVHEQLVLH